MITKVISGCQTGADEAGLAAAYDSGIETGGYIPKGHKTLKGPRPDLTRKYKLTEHSSSNYKERTWDNIQASDGTLRFANNFGSPGERCTFNGIKNYDRPYLDLKVTSRIFGLYDIKDGRESPFLYDAGAIGIIHDWIRINDIRVLNIAGNAEETHPGIYKVVYDFLLKVFEEYKNTKQVIIT